MAKSIFLPITFPNANMTLFLLLGLANSNPCLCPAEPSAVNSFLKSLLDYRELPYQLTELCKPFEKQTTPTVYQGMQFQCVTDKEGRIAEIKVRAVDATFGHAIDIDALASMKYLSVL